MYNIKGTWLIALMTVGVGAVVGMSEEDVPCCPPGQPILRKKIACWDPTTNVTTPTTLKCNSTGILYPGKDVEFGVDGAGQLVIYMANRELEYDKGEFCVTNATTMKDLSRLLRVAVVCISEEVRVIDEVVNGYCMIVSSILLLITAIVYALLPELRDTQGKSLVNLCLSMSLGFGILAGMQLVSYSDMNLCAARGFFVYFFMIAGFFWMNAISIQILRSVRRPSIVNYGWKEFGWYALYSWGCPAILTIAMAIVNYIPGDHLKPGIGLNHCFFFDSKQQWRYMYSVMTILILINIAIFIYVFIQLCRQSFSSGHVKALRFKFFMTLRLLIVMGVSWIFEMIGNTLSKHVVWEVFDIINSLQGVLIFLVLVVFRRRVIKAMHKHGWLDCVSGPIERYLAVGEDEEEVVGHTQGITLEEQIK